MKTIKKFPRKYFWQNIRYYTFFILIGLAISYLVLNYLPYLIPENISIYLVYAILGLILFSFMIILSLKQMKPYRKILQEVEKLPIIIDEKKKLKAIYQEPDFTSLSQAISEHQHTVQARVDKIDYKNQKLDNLIQSFPFPLIFINREKKVVFYNKNSLTLFSNLEHIAQSEDLFDQEILLKINETLLQKKVATIPYKSFTLSESKFLYKIIISPAHEDQLLLTFLPSDNSYATQKITNDLLKGISLNLISPIRELEQEDLPEHTRTLLNQARLKAESFHELFEMAANNWEQLEVINLEETFKKLFHFYQERYPHKQLNLDSSMLKLTKIKVYPMLFQTALKNIISNCFKHGRKQMAINLKSHIDEDRLYITISDNGYGIGQDNLDGIFDYFYQQALLGQTGPSKKFQLGLSIIKSAIFHHGGRVAIFSREGCGTTIRIQLPYKCKA